MRRISWSSRTSPTAWPSSRDNIRTSPSSANISLFFGSCTHGQCFAFDRPHEGPRDDNRLTSRLCRVKVMLITIPFGFLRVYGPNVWRDINRYEDMLRSGKLTPKDEVGLIARVLPS